MNQILSAARVQELFGKLNWPFMFTDREIRELDTINIVNGAIDWIAFPTPSANSGLSLLNLRLLCGTDPAHQPAFFDHPWYLDEPFGRVDCVPGWHVISAAVIPESINQSSDYVNSIRLGDRSVTLPSAVEIVLMLFLHYVAAKEQLLLKKHTWCSDVSSLGQRVTVGAFGRSGVFVSSHSKNYYSRGLGICVKAET